ncbi:STAM-binding protein [Ceratobasidium sp. AG-Ba]|nr:STAM-binding protein [Ceratobasidium sp. AG-Ba]
MSSRRPFSIQELAARSRPTGYDASKSLKDLLRIATAERNAGDQAKDAGDVESAFIHYAKASPSCSKTPPTPSLPSSPLAKRTPSWSLARRCQTSRLPAVLRLAHRTPRRRPLRPRRPTTAAQTAPDSAHTNPGTRTKKRAEHSSKRKPAASSKSKNAANDGPRATQEPTTKSPPSPLAAMPLPLPTTRWRTSPPPGSAKTGQGPTRKGEARGTQTGPRGGVFGIPYSGLDPSQARLVREPGCARLGPTPATATASPTAVGPACVDSATTALALGAATHWKRRTSVPFSPPTTQPPTQPPTRTGSRAEVHRPGSRAEHRPQPPTIRTDVFGVRNESAPAAYGPGQRPRRPSMSSPVKDRPPPNASFAYGAHPPTTGPGSHPPTTQAPVPRRRTSSHTATGRPPGFPVASAYQGGAAVGIGVGLDSRPNGGSFDSRANASFDARQNTSFDSRPNGSFDARQNGSFDARPNGGSFDARASGQSFESRASDPHAHARPSSDTRANGVFPAQPAQIPMPQDILPLESPSHSWRNEPEEMPVHAPAPRRNAHGHQPVRGSSYPPPVTTTSPPPGPISYPDLMSTHQREQGYLPSSHSMFSFAGFAQALAAERDAQVFGPTKTTMNTPPALLFQPNPDPTPPGGRAQPLPNPHESSPSKMYAGPGTSSGGVPTYPGMPQPRAPQSNYATRPPPAVPPKDYTRAPPHPNLIRRSPRFPRRPTRQRSNQTNRGWETASGAVARRGDSKVYVDRETEYASEPGDVRVVVGQEAWAWRATSDTCEMVEEELIMEFQESRGLITLGWIHTHPTQSCFMSSLDLHTHSGYQASLKEAFAIVCAPSQSPNVGIFRLTDPPGLQTILKCTIKESFHPHTASNIYTDADQGHVKMMKKLDLSIVDLRRHSN